MITRRGLFRRAAQTAIASPLAVAAVQTCSSPAPASEPDEEPEPLRAGTGGDVVITGGVGGASVWLSPEQLQQIEIHRRGWEAFREGMSLQRDQAEG